MEPASGPWTVGPPCSGELSMSPKLSRRWILAIPHLQSHRQTKTPQLTLSFQLPCRENALNVCGRRKEDCQGAPSKEPASPPSKACPTLTAGTGTEVPPFPVWAFCENVPGEARKQRLPRAELWSWPPGPGKANFPELDQERWIPFYVLSPDGGVVGRRGWLKLAGA